MGVEVNAVCMSSRCGDMANVFIGCSKVVKEVGAPMTNCESSSESPEDSKGKSAQLPVSPKEISGAKRLPVKAVDEKGRVVESESRSVVLAVEKRSKSQLIH